MPLDPEIVTIGELLVEMMRQEVDVPLGKADKFIGPFPSGAPAISMDAAARLGKSVGIIGDVGQDEFGQYLIQRLERDEVDISKIKQVKDLSTGVAFVSYFSDGSRKFIYHMDNSAAGKVVPEDVSESYITNSSMLYLSGSALAMSATMRKACLKAVRIADKAKLSVTFDPNVRPELLGAGGIRKIVGPALRAACIVTPSVEELKAITNIDNEYRAAEHLLKNAELVAVKNGSRGCRIYSKDKRVEAPAFKVKEIDPTGAGDAFSAAIAVGWLEGMNLKELTYFANAAGAKAVTAQGPMEGLACREKINEIVRSIK